MWVSFPDWSLVSHPAALCFSVSSPWSCFNWSFCNSIGALKVLKGFNSPAQSPMGPPPMPSPWAQDPIWAQPARPAPWHTPSMFSLHFWSERASLHKSSPNALYDNTPYVTNIFLIMYLLLQNQDSKTEPITGFLSGKLPLRCPSFLKQHSQRNMAHSAFPLRVSTCTTSSKNY